MKKEQIKIGGTYSAKVSGKLVTVRIDSTHANGGWEATNMATNRPVRIRSARRLRADVGESANTSPTVPHQANPTSEATSTPPRDTGEPVAQATQDNAKPLSLLNAAAKVLASEPGRSMRCGEIIHLAEMQGVWKPGNGKTPQNTLSASIMKEIKTKGTSGCDASRFTKTGKGLFTLA